MLDASLKGYTKLYGLDISESALKRCKYRFKMAKKKQPKLILESAATYSKTGFFDLIIISELIRNLNKDETHATLNSVHPLMADCSLRSVLYNKLCK